MPDKPGAMRRRTGLALPAVLFAIVMLSLLITALFTMTDLDARASRNREDWSRAGHLAEAGMTHALAVLRQSLRDTSLTRLLRGADGIENTADDGLLVGYGLPAGDEVPADGRKLDGGTYFVRLLNDPNDAEGDSLTDGNMRLLLRCRAVTSSGAEAELRAIVSNFALPALTTGGDLEISGELATLGPCGGIHANGNLTGGGLPSVATSASATGSISLNVQPQLAGQPALEIPELDPLTYCAGADVTVTGDFVLQSSTAPGTYCVHGNVTSSGDFGSAASKRAVSIIATGSISISSNVFIRAAHAEGILLLAGGDLDLQADWGGTGTVYGRGHCYISGKPSIAGQVVCLGRPDPPGAIDRTDQNVISGDATITYGCDGVLADVWRVKAWYLGVPN